MKLKQTRIRTTTKLLSGIENNSNFVLGTKLTEDIQKKLMDTFEVEEIKADILIFPPPFLGIMSERNSIGEYIAQTDKPKETAYRAQEWELDDWGGYPHSGTSYVPYKRYPRKFIEPKEMKLVTTLTSADEMFLLINNFFKNNEQDQSDIKFAANLMLEIFGEVEAFNLDNENNIIEIKPIETVNWEILPPGERIWEAFRNNEKVNVSRSEQTLIKERFDFIEQFKPDSVRKGIGGYTGYLIFEFKDKNMFIFDSIIYGDATYIFEDSWEHVSKMTKKEIINQNLAKDRIIHNKGWKRSLRKHLENN